MVFWELTNEGWQYASSEKSLVAEKSLLSASALYRDGDFIFAQFFTQVSCMANCLRLANHADHCDLSVLITGESGTGKNLLAQAIHNASAREKGPFIVVNTSALSESLIQSELFGHEKGAFTGADRQRKGQFELADNGTLALDEIGDMSISAQPKILHAVEYKQFQRLGAESLIQTNVRVIAITHHDLDELTESKAFRLDLLYRLREITIEVPPLRERREDIPLLCDFMLTEYCQNQGRTAPNLTAAATESIAAPPLAWEFARNEKRSAARGSSGGSGRYSPRAPWPGEHRER